MTDADKYPHGPCEAMFEEYAAKEPERLLALMRSGELDDVLMSQAAEVAGCYIKDKQLIDDVLEMLHDLLGHQREFVREGALKGFAAHVKSPDVRRWLAVVAERDENDVIRDIAKDLLDD